MEQSVFAHAADSLLAYGIAQNKPVVIGHGTTDGDVEGRRGVRSVAIKGMHRATRQGLLHHSATLGGGVAIDMWAHLTSAQCRISEGRTEVVRK
jgi:hypothetical protein